MLYSDDVVKNDRPWKHIVFDSMLEYVLYMGFEDISDAVSEKVFCFLEDWDYFERQICIFFTSHIGLHNLDLPIAKN